MKSVIPMILLGWITIVSADWLSFLDRSTHGRAISEYRDGHYSDALNLFIQACNEGNFEACNDAGTMYDDGRGISKNISKANEFYIKACNGGFSTGCTNKQTLQDIYSKNESKNDRLAKYEKDYLGEFENFKKTFPQYKFKFIQPWNKKSTCKIAVPDGDADPTRDSSYKIFWDGECKDGYAYGLGREIEKGNMTDAWQIGIYEKGMATGYLVRKNLLHGFLAEGEANYYGSSYLARRYVSETNGDIDIIYAIGKSSTPFAPGLDVRTSPFWNNTAEYHKKYPNFDYLYVDLRNNDLSPIEFNFQLVNDKHERHGWGFEKRKNGPLAKGEYIHDQFSLSRLPDEYMTKAADIIKEIEEAKNNALDAQRNAQLVKKQYLKKICKDSVKVSFMDNSEYKEICEDKDELQLQAKIENKLANLQREKAAMLQQKQQKETQQAQNEQYRQQQAYQQKQLELQRLQLEQQKKQYQDEQIQRSLDSLGRSADNMYKQNMQYLQQSDTQRQLNKLNNNLNNLNNTLGGSSNRWNNTSW